MLGYFVLDSIASSIALADIGGRPILAFTRDAGAVRVPVHVPGQSAEPGEALTAGGQGVFFGYRFSYILPDSARVDCTIRFRSLSCDDGWIAERTPERNAP
ncbi:MAG: hypothetical protein C0524_13845 [Rhodobacter sp.]|nr:hypothetical protein [Rhodobacter sp.]